MHYRFTGIVLYDDEMKQTFTKLNEGANYNKGENSWSHITVIIVSVPWRFSV